MSTENTQVTKWKPSPEQHALLSALLEESKKEKSTADFARKFLPFGRSLFDQIMDALDAGRPESYLDKVSEERRRSLFDELEQILSEIPRKRALMTRVQELDIFLTSKIRAVETAVAECSVKQGPERLILFLAPTGGGKTMLCNHLQAEKNARIVQVRAAWRRSESGLVPLIDICRAVGVRVGKNPRVAKMEDDLIKFCQSRQLLLVFDEGEHFGKSALNLIKFLLNETNIVIVLCAVPGEYDKWFDFFPNEAEQVARRNHAVYETSLLPEKDVALFFPKHQFDDEAAALKKIATEASTFGHYSLVRRVAVRLANIKNVKEGDVAAALKSAQAEMKRKS